MATLGGPDIITDGLVLALDAASERSYPGSGTVAYDLVGTNNGTLTNGVGFSNVNYGTWDFDGVNDYIDAGDINPTTAQTLSVWVKLDLIPSSQSSNYPQLIGKRDVDLQRAYFFSFQKSSNKVYWEIKDNVGTYFTLTSSKNSWNTTEWYCIDVTFKGSTGLAQIYINDFKDFNNGISIYKDIKKEYPEIADIRYALVEAYAQQNQFDKALTEIEEWLEINPDDERAKTIVEYLKEQL